jgi:hypothetical protein
LYDVVAKLAKLRLSCLVEEDLEDPELKLLLCSQLVMVVSSVEVLVCKCKHDLGTQCELLAVAGCDNKRPWSCTLSTLQECQHNSGHISNATMQHQPPTHEVTLEDDTSLKLGKARSTGHSSTQPAVMDEDELTQANINSVCKITPTQTQKSNQR